MMKLRRFGLILLLVFTVLLVALAFVIVMMQPFIPRSISIVRSHPEFPCGSTRLMGSLKGEFQRQFLVWMPDGTQILFGSGGEHIYAVNAAGTRLQNLVTVGPFGFPSIGLHADVSPDGTRLAYASCEFATGTEYYRSEQELYHYEIALMNLDGTGKQRLTENLDLDHYPVWSPDGKRIAFVSTRWKRSNTVSYVPVAAGLYVIAADGSRITNVVPEPRDIALFPPVWSPDGKHLAFLVTKGRRTPLQKILYIARSDGTELTKIGSTALVPPAWSPDGRFIAFVKTDEPRGIYTARPDGTDLQQVMKLNRRTIHVSWSPDGAAFYVITDDLELHVIAADGRGLRQVSLGTSLRGTGEKLVAWSPDGRRIAIYFPSYRESGTYVGPLLFTVARDGTDRRDLIRGDNNYNPMPANSPPWDDT